MITSARWLVAALVLLAAAAPMGGRAAALTPHVAIATRFGTIVVELDPVHAPITTADFLTYVDNGTFRHASFYRALKSTKTKKARIEIIQGGTDFDGKDPNPEIPLERTTKTHLHNVSGTIALARDTLPNTASTEFYFNLGDNRRLDADREKDHNGYAVFGRIISGFAVAQAIQAAPRVGEKITPRVPILSVKRVP